MPHPAFAQTEHRPWPLPDSPWVMSMGWHDLLFAHWPVDASPLREVVPACLEIDTFDGEAWIAVVPFRMTGVGPRGLPKPAFLSDFVELNVRTYVRVGGRPGVFFFSLDAENALAVRAARGLFHLPYFDADMACAQRGEDIAYRSVRTHAGEPPVRFVGEYGPSGPVAPAKPGSLEHWLTERYCLYSVDSDGRAYRGEVHHVQWPLQPAWARIEENEVISPTGLVLPDREPHLLFAREIQVAAWAVSRVG